jgi:hypothetical protein
MGNVMFHHSPQAAIHHDPIAAEVFHDVSANDNVITAPPNDNAAPVNPLYPVVLNEHMVSAASGRISSSHCRARENRGTVIAGEVTLSPKLSPDIMDVTIAYDHVTDAAFGSFGKCDNALPPMTWPRLGATGYFQVSYFPPFLVHQLYAGTRCFAKVDDRSWPLAIEVNSYWLAGRTRAQRTQLAFPDLTCFEQYCISDLKCIVIDPLNGFP